MKASNAKAMREALKEIHAKLSYLYALTDGAFNPPELKEVYEIAGAALDEPPRNCDVGAAGEQENRFNEYCENLSCACCPLCSSVACEFAWLQMPYEEGGRNEQQ